MKKFAFNIVSILIIIALPALVCYWIVGLILYWTTTSTIHVVSATYGANCGAPPGNATRWIQRDCEGHARCSYVVDYRKLGDSAPGCAKAFDLQYACPPDSTIFRRHVAGEAGMGSKVELVCRQASKNVQIQSATYGLNCGARIGNSTVQVQAACAGKLACNYKVDVNVLHDPAPRCSKNFVVEFSCPDDKNLHRSVAPPEAGFGSIVKMHCGSL